MLPALSSRAVAVIASAPHDSWHDGTLKARLPVKLFVVAVTVVVVMLSVLHLPFVQLRILRLGLARLPAAGVHVSVRRGSFNLLTMSAELFDLAVAPADRRDLPFASASRLSIDLGARLLRGGLQLERLEIERLRVEIVRGADGVFNLPATTRSGSANTGMAIPVRRLVLRDASVVYRDETQGLDARTGGVSLVLECERPGWVAGPLVALSPPMIRYGDVELGVTRLDGTLRYDGRTLAVEELTAEMPEARVQVDGEIGPLWSDPQWSLTMSGTSALSRLFSTLRMSPPAHGTVEFNAAVRGALGEPTASLSLSSDGVSWRDVGPVGLESTLAFSSEGIHIEPARLSLNGGTMTLRGRLGSIDRTAQVTAEWRSLPVRPVLGRWLPIPLAGRLTGRAMLRGNTEEGWTSLAGSIENHSQSDAPNPKTIGIEGAIVATLDAGRWRLEHRHRLDRSVEIAGTVNTLVSSDISQSTLTGTASVSSDDLSHAGRLLSRLGITIPADVFPQAGQLDAHLRVLGTLASPEAHGGAAVNGLRIANTGPISGDASIGLNAGRFRIDDACFSLDGNHLSGSASVDLDNRTLQGGVVLTLSDLSRVTRAWPGAWRAAGAISADIELAGSIGLPTVRGEIAGTNVLAAGQTIQSAEALVSYEASTLNASRITLRQPGGGSLVGRGAYSPASGQYDVDLRASDVSLTPVGGSDAPWPVDARFDGYFVGRGTIDAPTGAGHASFSKLGWAGRPLGQAIVDVQIEEGLARATGELIDLSTRLEATARLQAPRTFELVVDADDSDLTRILAEFGGRSQDAPTLTGRLSARIAADGSLDDPPARTVNVELRQLELHAGPAARLVLVAPVRARYAENSVDIDRLQLRAGSSTLELSGAVGRAGTLKSLDASLKADLGDAQPWLRAFGVAHDASLGGAVSAQLSAAGSLDRPILTGRFEIDRGTLAHDAVRVSQIDAEVNLGAGMVAVRALTGRWEEAAITGSASAPLRFFSEWLPDWMLADAQGGEAILSARLDDVTPATLEKITGTSVSGIGRGSVAVELRADGPDVNRVRGTVTLPELSFRSSGVTITQARPTRVLLADGRARIADWLWDVAGNRVTLAGQASLTPEPTLDLRAAGEIDLRLVQAFAPAWTTGGVADLALNIGGALMSPSLDGTLAIRQGEVRSTDPQIAASGIEGHLVLHGQQLRIDELRGSLNGGRFTATGEIRHERLQVTAGTITFDGSGIAMNEPAGIRSALAAALTLSFAPDRPRVAGTVTVERGAYRQPLSLAAGFLQAARQQATLAAGDGTSLFERLQLDVALLSEQDLIVDNNYGRMDIGLDLRVVGTLGRPSIVGRAAIREGGVMYLGGRTYQIETGTIDFLNPRAIVPNLSLNARTRIAGYDITLEISGPPDAIRATLTADPVLSQPDIVSLLTAGRLADEVGGAGAQIAREQLLGYLSGEILGLAGRAIGLDTLRLESGAALDPLLSDPTLIAGETDPAARLTISKRFSRYVEVVLSQNLREEGRLTWIVSYTPITTLELRTISRDDRSRSYEVRHNLAIGGDQTPPARPGAADAEARIVEVRFTGDAAWAEAELRSMLSLRPRDRFDFYRWQRDRDRIRRYLVDRGHLEARVSARRAEPAGSSTAISLQYDIDAGPMARLQIEGYEFPARFRRELDAVWSNAVFDEARVADLTLSVRRYLAGEGFLRADVATSLLPAAAGEKLIRISVNAGERTAMREIRFEGNRDVSRETLEMAISSLGADVWLTPQALADEVVRMYRERGRLAAKANAGPLEFSEGTAILTVHIDEGPQFVVAQVSATGVRALSEADVLGEFGQSPGDVYSTAAHDRGRRDVEAAYARHGFTTARASVSITADFVKGSVDVTLAVEEGPQRIIEHVEIEPVRGVDPDVVAQALGLEAGTPVNMEDWYVARRRLLDTGLFRRVDIEAADAGESEPPPAVMPVTARVMLDRQPIWRLRYGLDVADEPAPLSEGRAFGAGFSADVQRRGVFGRAGTVGGAVRLNADERTARTFLTFPTFRRLPISSNVFLSRSRRYFAGDAILGFITDKTSFTLEQRLRLARSVQLSYGYQFERNHTFDPERDPDDPLGLDFTASAARLTSTMAYDTRDDPFDPTRGLFHSSNFEYAPSALGSDVRFVKYLLQQFAYARVAPGLVSASAVRLGMGRGFGQALIPSERFFAGGGGSVRGFAENSLGGFDSLGEPRGGHALVVVNQEARFPIFRWIRGVGFVDAGNVFPRASETSLSRLAVGAGAGIRFSTPFGLFRLDLGVPVVRRDHAGGARWHFAFGQLF